jgi:hypothetical protein
MSRLADGVAPIGTLAFPGGWHGSRGKKKRPANFLASRSSKFVEN